MFVRTYVRMYVCVNRSLIRHDSDPDPDPDLGAGGCSYRSIDLFLTRTNFRVYGCVFTCIKNEHE